MMMNKAGGKDDENNVIKSVMNVEGGSLRRGAVDEVGRGGTWGVGREKKGRTQGRQGRRMDADGA